jgi:hypothetical protein
MTARLKLVTGLGVVLIFSAWWFWLKPMPRSPSAEARVYRWEDGGSVGCELRTGDSVLAFCIDGRMSVPWPRLVYTGVTHPDQSGAAALPFGGREELEIVLRLHAWTSGFRSTEEQEALWAKGHTDFDRLTEEELVLYEIMDLSKRLYARQIKDTTGH